MKNPTFVYGNHGEQQSPLLQFTYRGWQDWMSPQLLPTPIYYPEQLANKLPAFEQKSNSEGCR